MAEWWTYGLSDFLMFPPEACWRLLARHNAAWWPAQVAGIAAAIALPWLVHGGAGRCLLLLAAAWAWVGWSFFRLHYSEIFLAAPWLACACAVQAMLLVAASLRPGAAGEPAPRAGMVLLVLALAWPLLAPFTGRPLVQAQVFGFLPDPTVLATLGCVLALPALGRAWRIVLAIVPGLGLLLGAATRWRLAGQ